MIDIAITEKERTQRKSICENCDKLNLLSNDRKRCSVCGCPIISRITIGCPIGKFK